MKDDPNALVGLHVRIPRYLDNTIERITKRLADSHPDRKITKRGVIVAMLEYLSDEEHSLPDMLNDVLKTDPSEDS